MMKTLKENPQKREQTLSLIEKSFDYSQDNSFAVDFYPLMKEGNASNNYILIENDEVIGHIGVLYKELLIGQESFKVAMFGGIAIDKKHRGQGLFKSFFKDVLSSIDATAFNLLWSDKVDLYESFNFYPCVEQYEYTGSIESDNPDFIKMKLRELSDSDIQQLSSIYNESNELRYARSTKDWSELKNIISSDIYIKRDDKKICNYFFMNKGEDLSNIIYEYGDLKDIEEISTYGILWSPHNFEVENEEDKSLLYAVLMQINNFESFKQFVQAYTQNKIEVQKQEKGEVIFSFEELKFTFKTEEFLQGIFGPNKLQELMDTPKILISGLDSI